MKKSRIFLCIIILLCILLTVLICMGQAVKDQELTELLLKAKDKNERLDILTENRELVTKKFAEDFIDFSWKKWEATEEAGKAEEIAMEMACFLDNNYLKGLVMYYKPMALELQLDTEKLPEILSCYDKAIKFFRMDGYLLGEGWCYYRRSIAINNRYEFTESMEDMEKALEIFHNLGIKPNEADCYCFLGRSWFNAKIEKNYNKAGDKYYEEKGMAYFNKALEIYRDINDKFGEYSVYSDLGLCYSYDYEKGLYYREKCLALALEFSDEDIKQPMGTGISSMKIYKESNKITLTALSYKELGLFEANWGKLGDAIRYYKKGLRLLEDAKEEKESYSLVYMTLYENLAFIYSFIGKQRECLEYYEKAIEIAKNRKDYDSLQMAIKYSCAGEGLLAGDMTQEAIKKFTSGLALLKDTDERYFAKYRKVVILYNLGEAYFKSGKFREAENYLEETIKSGATINSSYYVKSARVLISEIYFAEDNPEKALDYGMKYEIFTGPRELLFLAKLYSKLGEKEKVIECSKSLKTVKILMGGRDWWDFYLEEGKFFEELGDFEYAFTCYKTSIDLIEKSRNYLKIEDYKRGFMRNKIEVYERLIKLLLKMNKETESFEYNERARARDFLDILGNNRIDIHNSTNMELIKKAEELDGKIRFYSNKESEDEKILLNLKEEYEELLGELKQESPEYASLKTVSPLSLKEIQSLLDKDSAILEYFCTDKDLLLWIITEDRLFTRTISIDRKELNNMIFKYREEIAVNMTVEKMKSDEWKKASNHLYELLIGDAEKIIKEKHRLIIVPHRSLHYLPFNTLLNGQDRLLVEKYEIVYLPSATLLSYCREKNTDKRDYLIAFEYGNLNRAGYSPLPGSITEVDKIEEFFPHNKVFSERNMTGETVKNECKNGDLIHFATHGILDPQTPVFSKLVLAEDELDVYEIFDMELHASLVTLSACRTGLGELSEGDELTGFSRAFIYAGTPCVCVSLWDVSDKATSDLMETFYFYLKEGRSKSQSLRLAELDMINKYHHPFFWAPFVLIGDWD
jgi:CHAT domain-containing protein